MGSPNPQTNLYSASKIIRICENGKLELLTNNLTTILSHSKTDNSAKTYFVSVTGGSKSGKSFISNLIIHYYKSKESGVNWFNSLVRETSADDSNQPEIRGFSWSSLTHPSLIQCNDNLPSLEGAIYLWPKPFLIQGHKNPAESCVLWVLHVVIGTCANNSIRRRSEQFMLLVCPLLVEILHNNNEFQLLESMQNLSRQDPTLEICESILYILRESETSKRYEDFPKCNAKKEEIRNYTESLWKGSQREKSDMGQFKNSSIAKLPEYQGQFHDAHGYLTPEAKRKLHISLRNIIEKVTSGVTQAAARAGCSLIETSKLTEENMSTFLQKAVDITNSLEVSIAMEQDREANSSPDTLEKPLAQITLSKDSSKYMDFDNTPMSTPDKGQPESDEQSDDETQPVFQMQNSSEGNNLEYEKKFQFVFQTQLAEKIKTELIYNNVAEVFHKCFDEAADDLPGSTAEEIKNKYAPHVDKLIAIVEDFITGVQRSFLNNVCFEQDHTLQSICSGEMDERLEVINATTYDSGFVTGKIFQQACEHLRHLYLEDNKEIVANERKIQQQLLGKFRQFYASEMQRYFDESKSSFEEKLKQQKNNHNKLYEECMILYRECTGLNGKKKEVISAMEEQLKICLNEEFVKHQRQMQIKQSGIKQDKRSQKQLPLKQTKKPEQPKNTKNIPSKKVTETPQGQWFSNVLIFQFTLHDVTMARMGMDGKPEILGKELATIGKTEDSILVGNETGNFDGIDKFSLKTVLESHKASGRVLEITIEYLVGKLLNKLRNNAENKAGSKFANAIISCPFWIDEDCRSKFMTAARTIAKFDFVKLVDENECVALLHFNECKLPRHQKKAVLVLSQNSGFIDVGLHGFDLEDKTKTLEKQTFADSKENFLDKCFSFFLSILSITTKKNALKNYLRKIKSERNCAAVVSSGEKPPQLYLNRLQAFPCRYAFAKSKHAVILGALLSVSSEEKLFFARNVTPTTTTHSPPVTPITNDDTLPRQTFTRKDFSSEGGILSQNNIEHQLYTDQGESRDVVENASAITSNDQTEDKQLHIRMAFLFELCDKLQTCIEEREFQSKVAKKLMVNKVNEGRSLAAKNAGDTSLDQIEKQISILEQIGAQFNI